MNFTRLKYRSFFYSLFIHLCVLFLLYFSYLYFNKGEERIYIDLKAVKIISPVKNNITSVKQAEAVHEVDVSLVKQAEAVHEVDVSLVKQAEAIYKAVIPLKKPVEAVKEKVVSSKMQFDSSKKQQKSIRKVDLSSEKTAKLVHKQVVFLKKPVETVNKAVFSSKKHSKTDKKEVILPKKQLKSTGEVSNYSQKNSSEYIKDKTNSGIKTKQNHKLEQSKTINDYKQEYISNNLALLNSLIKENLRYPKLAKKRGFEGRVLISFKISSNGELSDIHTSGEVASILKRAAVKTVRKASKQFPHPKVDLLLQIPIVYKLYKE